MRLSALAAASAMALGTAACAPHVDYAHKTSLDCPDRQGELQRTGMAPDRRSCTYSAGGGTEVTLQLTAANIDATTALSAIEATLVGPAAPGAAAKDAKDPKAAKDAKEGSPAVPAPPTPPAPPAKPGASGPGDAARAAQEAAQDSHDTASKDEDWGSGGHRHRLTINGRHMSDEDGEVSLPGVHVTHDGDHAQVDVMGIHVDANGDDATFHVVRDVRLAGHAFRRERDGVRATFLAKRANLPDGYRFVGYQAAGPKTGPITVAVVKSRDEIDNGDRLYRDIRRLVRRNGGA